MAESNNSEDEILNEKAALNPRDQEDQALRLTEQIAERYSTRRLSKVVSNWAGSVDRLDYATQRFLEGKVGTDLGGVRILRGPVADALTNKFNAHAVTIAKTRTVALNSNSPKTVRGTTAFKALLAHEFTHVKQAQKGLHFDAMGQGKNTALEAEAHAAEDAVNAGENPSPHKTNDLKGERDKAVIAKALAMLAERERIDWERGQ